MEDFNYVPLFRQGINEITDGIEIRLPDFCSRNCLHNEKCKEYYKELIDKSDGNYQCPYGFASKVFSDEDGNKYIFTAMRIIGVYSSKLADPKLRNLSREKNYRKITEKETDHYSKIFLEYQKKTRAYDELHTFIQEIFHDIRRFNGELKGKSTQLYNKANSGGRNGQFLEYAKSIQALCAFTTLRLNAFDFMYNEVPLAATERASYNMYQMFDKAKHCLSAKAEERGIKIKINPNGQCGDIKAFDCIELLPYIFLDNGIKYSNKGSTIYVDVQDSMENCKVEVVSQSLPLERGEQDKIFQRGYRGVQAQKMTSEGMGIGLYTAKKICDIHNAAICVEENEDEVKHIHQFIIKVKIDRVVC